MKNRNDLLDRLLRALVEEWGFDRVAKELARINQGLSDLSSGAGLSQPTRSSKRKIVVSPTEQVEKALLDPARKELILRLAKRYEDKEFLPTVAAVKEFLMMMGNDPGELKDRVQAFRSLLRSLLQLPPARLHQLINSSLHSGPSQLGPISDAIAEVGDHLPRRSPHDVANDTAQQPPEIT